MRGRYGKKKWDIAAVRMKNGKQRVEKVVVRQRRKEAPKGDA